jgi:hypothetical protein
VFSSSVAFWKRGIIGSAAVLGIALISALGGSSDGGSPVPAGRTRPKDFDAPLPVRRIVQRACLDCHSDETIWPWYSKIPLVSSQVHDDVNNGREFMDFSHWSEYSAEEQHSYASQIAHATSARVMPPPRYLWMHRDAKLSAADLETLKEWARRQSEHGFPKQ